MCIQGIQYILEIPISRVYVPSKQLLEFCHILNNVSWPKLCQEFGLYLL